jgi:hypothetical protein
VVKTVDEFFMFVCWWVGLGIASSVGLGKINVKIKELDYTHL